MELVNRYWGSSEGMEPLFKYVGIRNKLKLVRVNKDLQDIVYSWFRRKQMKLLLITPSHEFWREPINFNSASTICVSEECQHVISNVLKLFPRLESINIADYELIKPLLDALQATPELLQNVKVIDINEQKRPLSNTFASKCIELMEFMPHLDEVNLRRLRVGDEFYKVKPTDEISIWSYVVNRASQLNVLCFEHWEDVANSGHTQ